MILFTHYSINKFYTIISINYILIKLFRNCNQIHCSCILIIGKGDPELNIIQRLHEKDEAALVSLMNQYGDYLLKTAFLLVKDRQTAEEVVQDTFPI